MDSTLPRRRVLFVDDEQPVLDGLRRLMRNRRREWDMAFASSPERALEMMSEAPFDVVISDIRMPGMDGAELLGHIRADHPDTVRIVLTGQAELQVALRATTVAHQYLSKPCDPKQLGDVIARATQLRDLLRDERIERLVGGVDALPSLPEIIAELDQVIDDPDAGPNDVARVVERDLGISAKVLQLVNSSFFGLPRRTNDVAAAVSYLGLDLVRRLVTQAAIFEALGPRRRVPGFDQEGLRKSGIRLANLARALLEDPAEQQDAYLGGLLHDVGMLVMASHLPAELEAVLAYARRQRCTVAEAEAALGRSSHAHVGAFLLGLWGLPHPVVETVAFHHSAEARPGERFGAVDAVYIAHLLCEAPGGALPPPPEPYLERLGVRERWEEWCDLARGGSDA